MSIEENIGNILTVSFGVIGVTAAFFTLKGHVNNNESKIIDIKKQLEKETVLIHSRIEKTQDAAKKHIEKTDSEIKELTESVHNVLIETSEIKGMIRTLLDK